jgi:hypothetical protein
MRRDFKSIKVWPMWISLVTGIIGVLITEIAEAPALQMVGVILAVLGGLVAVFWLVKILIWIS